jgi:hypothetical protein
MNAVASTEGSDFLDALNSYRNGTELPDGRGVCINEIDGYPSYCIDIDADLPLLGIPSFKNDTYIPGLEIKPLRLRVLNIHT